MLAKCIDVVSKWRDVVASVSGDRYMVSKWRDVMAKRRYMEAK